MGKPGIHEIVYTILLLIAIVVIPACDPDRGGIKGTVIDEDTGDPIQNAKILVVSSKDSVIRQSVTDASGYYQIKQATFGINQVHVWKDGYMNTRKYADVRQNDTITIDFELKVLKLKTPNRITVKITDELGKPVANATVDLYKQVEPGFVYAGTEYTETDGTVNFFPGLIEKNETITYELRVAAQGFYNTTELLEVAWIHSHPTVVVKLQKL